jgi:poly [ADP-ribose] polymerase
MMEFEINMSEMPLGKLSKDNIQKGVLFWSLWSYLFVLCTTNYDLKILTCILCRIWSLNWDTESIG